jgi:hypothetical protein
MRLFKEFLLDAESLAEQQIYMPAEAEIINIVKTALGLKLLVIVKQAALDTKSRKFKICLSDEIFYAKTVEYIGSFESDVGIKHVIEIIKE